MARGDRKFAEELAEDIRTELGLSNLVRLDPLRLLAHLQIPALSLTQLTELLPQDASLRESVAVLQSEDQSSLSAVTVFRGHRRLIVFNDKHPAGRRCSDLCHEAAHSLLLHPPAPPLDEHGCRAWDANLEEEADYLAGALLIPGKGARYAAKADWSLEHMATRFGCSVDMARWRNNVSGGQRLRTRSV